MYYAASYEAASSIAAALSTPRFSLDTRHMDSSLFFGGSVIAALLAGSVALFAPCCISVMLPAYFATAFQNRRTLVAMTFLFAAGIATVILPIAVGAVAIQSLVTS